MKSPASIHLRQFAPWLLALVSATMAVAAYLQALNYPFISDDISYIVTNKGLAELRLTELWRLLVEPYNVGFEFLPLRDLSYWIDIALFGQNPAALRLHNILLYLLCLPLVYATTASLWRYFRPADASSAPWAAAAVTSLFALHPALVESVVWISGRKYILPNFFSLLALWLAVSVKREQRFSSRYAVATLAAFVAVMFSKASYVAVAPVIAMLWLIFWRDIPPPQRRRSLLLWPLAILALAAFLLLIFIVNNEGFDTVPAYFGVEAVTRSLAVLGGLTRISISPEARHFFYPVFEGPWFATMVALGVAVLGSAGWGVAMLMRKRSLAGFALLVFLLLCMPYLQLVPAKPPSLVSDRYVALAIWPVALLIVSLVWRLKPLPRTILLLFIALPWFFQTVERTRDWRNFEKLVDADSRAYPGYYMPAFYTIINSQMHNGLYREASAAANNLTSPEIRNVMVKLIQADRILRIDSLSTGKPHEAMNLLLELGRILEQAPPQTKWDTPMLFTWLQLKVTLANEWQYLAEIFPGEVSVRYNAGAYLLNMHRYKDAEIHLRAAIESRRLPQSLLNATYLNLGIAYIKTGRPSEAEIPLRAALAQPQPDMRAHCLLAEAYKQSHRPEEAARAADKCPSRASGEEVSP